MPPSPLLSDKVTLAMSIVALGVVYGDIGTSPLYTMQTFLAGQGGVGHADETAVIGMLSLVFWTMTLITTIEYVLICMRVDNKGEGGIFALYSLLRRYGRAATCRCRHTPRRAPRSTWRA